MVHAVPVVPGWAAPAHRGPPLDRAFAREALPTRRKLSPRRWRCSTGSASTARPLPPGFATVHHPGRGAPCDRMTRAQLLRAVVLKSKLRPSSGTQLVSLGSTRSATRLGPLLSITRNDDDLQLPRVMECYGGPASSPISSPLPYQLGQPSVPLPSHISVTPRCSCAQSAGCPRLGGAVGGDVRGSRGQGAVATLRRT
jgi:hypothetical protein